jgi:5,10-methylenetetrahydromethanopterin reductase
MPVLDIGLLPQEAVTEAAVLAGDAEELGFGGVWCADSQSVFRDGYVALGLCAAHTRKLVLGTGVTNPVTRHPTVLASLAATLAEVSEGRFILGIGVGESAVQNVGLKPARLGQLEEVVKAVRALTKGEEVTFGGHRLQMSWRTRQFPIYVAASAPRALRLAGRIADGVIFQVGAHPAFVRYALREIASGAEDGGREMDELVLCMRLAACVDDDREHARREALPYAAVAANTVARTVPTVELPAELVDDLRRLRSSYDYGRHGYADAEHQRLLTDSVMDAVAVAGTPAEAVARFTQLAALGVDRFIVPIDLRNKRGQLRLLARHVLPAVAATHGDDGTYLDH